MNEDEIKFTEGDLVEITTISYTGWKDVDTTLCYGFVVATPDKMQLSLFPQVNVYLIKSGTVKAFSSRIVKIISPYSMHTM